METRIGNENSVNLDRLLDDLKTVVRDGQELLKASASTIKERAIAGARTTDRVVREKPYQTMGVAFALGVLTGVLATGLLTRHSEENSED